MIKELTSSFRVDRSRRKDVHRVVPPQKAKITLKQCKRNFDPSSPLDNVLKCSIIIAVIDIRNKNSLVDRIIAEEITL